MRVKPFLADHSEGNSCVRSPACFTLPTSGGTLVDVGLGSAVLGIMMLGEESGWLGWGGVKGASGQDGRSGLTSSRRGPETWTLCRKLLGGISSRAEPGQTRKETHPSG